MRIGDVPQALVTLRNLAIWILLRVGFDKITPGLRWMAFDYKKPPRSSACSSAFSEVGTSALGCNAPLHVLPSTTSADMRANSRRQSWPVCAAPLG